MALQGTIETFPVIDVLHLLSAAGHTGRLTVEGDRGHAELWVADRVLHGGRVDGHEQTDAAALVMHVLRHTSGVFLFENVALPDALGAVMPPTPIEDAVEGAQRRLAEWHAVEAVVPSTAHRLRLSSALPVEQVVLDRQQWAFVVAASRWPALAEAAAELGMDDLTAGRMAVDMVQAGMLVVEDPIEGTGGWTATTSSDVSGHDTGLVVESQVVAETVVVTDAGPSFLDEQVHVVGDEPLEVRLDEALGLSVDLTAPAPSAAGPAPGPASADAAGPAAERATDPAQDRTDSAAPAGLDVAASDDAAGGDPGFPERFPIDDLLGSQPADDWGVIGEPLPPVTTDPFAENRDATPSEPAVAAAPAPTVPPAPEVPSAPDAQSAPPLAAMTFAGLPDLDDATGTGTVPGGPTFAAEPVDEAELRRQMSQLSPKAAEAVAAALEQLADPSTR